MNSIDQNLDKLDLSPYTKKSYWTSYNKLMRSRYLDRQIETTGEDAIIYAIERISDNPNTCASILNVCILLERANLKPYEGLIKYRDKLKILISEHHNAIHADIKENFPSYEEFVKYMNDAYLNKDYLKYIISYLLIYHSVRNQAMNEIVAYDKKDSQNKSP